MKTLRFIGYALTAYLVVMVVKQMVIDPYLEVEEKPKKQPSYKKDNWSIN